MQLRKIKDIGKVVSGSTPRTDNEEYWNGHIPWVTPKEINRLNSQYLDKTERNITALGFKSCAATMLPKGSILFTSRAPIGLVAISNIEVCTNQGFKSIIINKNYHPLYVYYYLKQNTKQLNDLGTGTTFKELSKSTFEKFEIPFPETLSDQIRIATVLNRVETLIKERKRSIDLLDDLLKSTFFKMFGDPINNEKKWERKTLGDLVDKLGDGLHGTPNYTEEGEYHFINGNNLNDGEIIINKLTKSVNQEEYTKYQKQLNENSILVSINGSLGRIAFYRNEKIILGKSVCYFNIKPKIANKIFIFHLLKSSYFINYAQSQSTGSTIKNVSLKTMRSLPVLYPPLKLQNQFAGIVEKAEVVKSFYNESLIELENLFGSLSQKAFKGELDLSNIRVLVEEEEYQSYVNDRTEPHHFPEPKIIVEFPEIDIPSAITSQMQEFIKSTNALSKIMPKTPATIKLPANFEKFSRQIDQINKMMVSFEKLPKIPDSVSQAMKTFENIKAVSSTLQREEKSASSERHSGNITGIVFNEKEGLAVLEKEFSEMKGGFTFQDFEKFLKGEKIKYTYKELQYFIFKQIQEKKIKQHFWSSNLTNRLQQERDGEKAVLYLDEHIWFEYTNINYKNEIT